MTFLMMLLGMLVWGLSGVSYLLWQLVLNPWGWVVVAGIVAVLWVREKVRKPRR